MITDPIIEELHAIREQIYNECKEQGISLTEHARRALPLGFKYSNLKPSVTSLKKCQSPSAVGP